MYFLLQILFTLALGFFVLRFALKEDKSLKLLGIVIGWFILIASCFSLIGTFKIAGSSDMSHYGNCKKFQGSTLHHLQSTDVSEEEDEEESDDEENEDDEDNEN